MSCCDWLILIFIFSSLFFLFFLCFELGDVGDDKKPKMGNADSRDDPQRLFDKSDVDEDGRLNLEELMHIENIDEVLSPMLLFQLDAGKAGSVTREEFGKLFQYVADRRDQKEQRDMLLLAEKEKEKEKDKEKDEEHRSGIFALLRRNKKHTHTQATTTITTPAEAHGGDGKDGKDGKDGQVASSSSGGGAGAAGSHLASDSHSNVKVSLDSEIVATQLKDRMGRDRETPMIIGGAHAHPVTVAPAPALDDEFEDQAERIDFCKQLLGTHHGRQEFVSWLWRLADMHHTEKVTEKELQLVLEALKHDGIDLSQLSFNRLRGGGGGSAGDPSSVTNSESETEHDSESDDSHDEDSSSGEAQGAKIHTPGPITFKDLRLMIIDPPTPETVGAVVAHLEKHKITHVVRLCAKLTYDVEELARADIQHVVMSSGFPSDGEVPTPEFLEQWRRVVQSAKEHHGGIAVHGLTGGSRACVLVAYSLIELGLPFERALKTIRKKRPHAITWRQEKFLQRFKKVRDEHGASRMVFTPEVSDHTTLAAVEKIIDEFATSSSGYLTKEEFMVFANLIVHAYKAVSEERHTVGKYQVGEKLGEGAVGTVRVAVDMETGVRKAIKIISRGRVTDMSRLDTEAKAMVMLFHPNVVRLHEVLENDTNVFFVMDLCSGGSLADYLSLQPCSEELARSYFRQLCEAVSYCHSQGVAHRDLKVENLLLDQDGMLKITDFGQASIFPLDWDVCSTSVVGTSYHLTPEQINGDDYSGEKKDTWSVGIILYHMLVGRPPFFSTNIQLMLEDIKRVRYDVPTTMSPDAADLVACLLRADPDARIPLSEALNHPWLAGPHKPPQLSTYAFPLSSLDGLFGEQLTTPADVIVQWEQHWKVALHKHQIVGVPVHHVVQSDPPPPDCLCRLHCFSPEQNNLKFTLSLCLRSSTVVPLVVHHVGSLSAQLSASSSPPGSSSSSAHHSPSPSPSPSTTATTTATSHKSQKSRSTSPRSRSPSRSPSPRRSASRLSPPASESRASSPNPTSGGAVAPEPVRPPKRAPTPNMALLSSSAAAAAALMALPATGTQAMPVGELFPQGLMLRFDLFSGSPWSFFKTIKALQHSLDSLSHPLPPAHETRVRRRKAGGSSLRSDDKLAAAAAAAAAAATTGGIGGRSASAARQRPASPAPRQLLHGDDTTTIPINPPLLSRSKTPTLKESAALSSPPLHSYTEGDLPGAVATLREPEPFMPVPTTIVLTSSASSRHHKDHKESSRHHKKAERERLADQEQHISQLTARVNDQDETIRQLARTVEKQDEIIKQLQRHVETLRSDMFQMQNYQARVVHSSHKKHAKESKPDRHPDLSSSSSSAERHSDRHSDRHSERH